MMDWKKVDEDDYEFDAHAAMLSAYLPSQQARWKWTVWVRNTVNTFGGRADTEAEAKAAAIAKARELLAANRDELDKALAVLNACATLEPTP